MLDGFNEHMVTRRSDWKKTLKIILVVFSAIIVAVLPILFFLFTGIDILQFALITLIGSIWGAKIIIKRMHVEFEYSVHSSEIVIDKILGRGIRKRVLSIDCQKFEILAPVKSAYEHLFKNVEKTIDASSSEKSQDRWFAIFQSKENVRTLLIFEPNQRMLDAFKLQIPSKFKTS